MSYETQTEIRSTRSCHQRSFDQSASYTPTESDTCSERQRPLKRHVQAAVESFSFWRAMYAIWQHCGFCVYNVTTGLLTYERRSRIDDEGARRGTSSTKNVSTCRAAIMLLALTATRPVDPQLTATSIAWHTWQLSGPLYTSPITAPVLNTPDKSVHLHRYWHLMWSSLQQWQTSQQSSDINKGRFHKDKNKKDQLPSYHKQAKRQVLDLDIWIQTKNSEDVPTYKNWTF